MTACHHPAALRQRHGRKWFRGTAHAIYQNFSYIDDYDPDFVLILSGDHIYKMNYESMLDFIKNRKLH